MTTTRLRALLVTVLLGVALSAGVGLPARAAEGGVSCKTNIHWQDSISRAGCTGGPASDGSGVEGKTPPPSQGDTKKPPAKKKAAEPAAYKKAYQDQHPTDAPGQWDKANAQGVQGAAHELKQQLDQGVGPRFRFSGAWLSLYSIMFALGWVLAAAAAMIATVQVANRREVNGLLVARKAFTRLVFFSPICAAGPLILGVVADASLGLAGGFLDLARAQVGRELDWLVGALGAAGLIGTLIPGGSAVEVGIFFFLMACLLGIVLELMVAKFLVFVLALLSPILLAASINPKWSGGIRAVGGGLLAAFLAPAALYFTWGVAGAALSGFGLGEDAATRIMVFLVAAAVALLAPVGVGLVLSYVVPAFAQSMGTGRDALHAGVREAGAGMIGRRRGGAAPRSRGSRAANADQMAAKGAGRGSGASGGGKSAAVQGGGGAASGGAGAGGASAGGAGGAAAGGAAAAGPLAAVMAWMKIAKASNRGARAAADGVGDRVQDGSGGAGQPGPGQPGSRPPGRGAGGGTPKPGGGPRRPGGTEQAPAGRGQGKGRGSRT